MSLRFLIPLFILIVVDVYAFQAFKTAFKNKIWFKRAYVILDLLLYGGFILGIMTRGRLPRGMSELIFTLLIAFFLPKLLITLMMIVEDVVRGIQWIWKKIKSRSTPDTDEKIRKRTSTLSRSQFLSRTAITLAGIPFIGMLNGIIREKYNYQVRKVKVPIQGLPSSFEGLTITHISDIHTGSFDNRDAVKCGMDLVNQQESDLIFFTGDLINTFIAEIEGFEEIYSSLNAKEGVFSTLGNHDYGDYARWNSPEEKAKHFQKVMDTHAKFGWRLLKNENHLIQRGEDTLAIIGVENWGAKINFPKYGKIAEAVEGTENAKVKLLLSHDPSHWEGEILPGYKDIDITFSGHTHGMQFGVEIPGWKWSPIKYLYSQWAGLYQKGQQFLYVNRGFGFLAFSGRVGMRPEITVMELVKA